MTQSGKLILLATLGSLGSLLAALYFQYVVGLAPCPLCIWQRWPHLAAVLIGLLAIKLGGRVLPLLGGLAALTSAAIGVFHVGVEQKWWEGLATCSSGSIEGISAERFLRRLVSNGASTSRPRKRANRPGSSPPPS